MARSSIRTATAARSLVSSSSSTRLLLSSVATDDRSEGHLAANFARADTAAALTAAFSKMTRLYTNRMYLAGALVDGPMSPRRLRIWVESMVNSQSSMNSHRCRRDDSVVSGTRRMRETMPPTMDRLNSNPPSSRRKLERKPMMTRCLDGYVRHSCWRDRTTVILYSSAMSVRKDEICFSRRSMEFSDPVLRRVVMARVATDRFESAMSDSRSSLHLATTRGWACATVARVFMAANRTAGLGLDRDICRTDTAGLRSCGSAWGRPHTILAASYDTSSDLWRRDDSRKAYPAEHMGDACWMDPG
mmetsp:Transcript_10020/g.19111  ORF Transcript_10020/g.19111 Transcript_10020/m.19111 type:complete len:303 (+) Transcript_10020:3613-4521(+)